MRICLVTPDPGHPLLAATAQLLRGSGHEVFSLDPGAYRPGAAPGTAESARARGDGVSADVCLLKARTPRALALARSIEERGVPVLNSTAATARCQNRAEMAGLARTGGLPFAETAAVAPLADIAAAGPPDGPLVIKSLHSRRGDLVARVDTADRLRELAAEWLHEPVVVQRFTVNSGWDHKLWVIDGEIFAGLRHSELAPAGRGPTLPLPTGELSPAWTGAALRAGEVFGLDVYGVDIIDAGGGKPLVVDINAFPGIRGQAGAPQALADLALRTGAGDRPPAAPPPGAASSCPASPPRTGGLRNQGVTA